MLQKGFAAAQSFYVSRQDEDSEETGEDVSRDDYWDYAEILWNGIKAEAIPKSFDALDYENKRYWKKLQRYLYALRQSKSHEQPFFL